MSRIILVVVLLFLVIWTLVSIYNHYRFPDTKGTAVAVEVYSEINKGNYNVYVKYKLTLESGETLYRDRPVSYVPMFYDSAEKRLKELKDQVQIPGEPIEIWIDHDRYNWDTKTNNFTAPYNLMIFSLICFIALMWSAWPFLKKVPLLIRH